MNVEAPCRRLAIDLLLTAQVLPSMSSQYSCAVEPEAPD